MRWRQPRIFISYRRDDSAVHAVAVRDELIAGFGEGAVFQDVTDIDYGDRYAEIIERHIADCDVVVALIGPRWITGAGDAPRIAEAGDLVRHEIATALRLGKRVIPVLVGGAALPERRALPPDIAGLLDLNALSFTDRQLGGEGVDRLVDAIRRRRSTREVSDAIRRRIANGAGFAAAVTVLIAAWIALFDALALDTRTASVVLWLADRVAPAKPSPALQILVVDRDTERALGRPFERNPATRRDHAELIDRLARAGARMVAFDIYLPVASDADAALAAAIARARSAGTAVVFGANEIEGDRPRMAPAIRDAVTVWAMLCAGQRLGYAAAVPLATQPAGGATQARAIGLALAAVHPGRARIATDSRKVIVASAMDGSIREYRYTETEALAPGQPCWAGAPGDIVATALHRGTSREALNGAAHRAKYEQALSMDAAALQRRYAGKTVLVGLAMPQADLFAAFGAAPRHGIELHADAASALLQDAIVRPLAAGADFAFMLAYALVGGRLAIASPGGALHRWRRPLFAALAAGHLALAVAACIVASLLLNAVYHLAALALGAFAAARLAPRARGAVGALR